MGMSSMKPKRRLLNCFKRDFLKHSMIIQSLKMNYPLFRINTDVKDIFRTLDTLCYFHIGEKDNSLTTILSDILHLRKYPSFSYEAVPLFQKRHDVLDYFFASSFNRYFYFTFVKFDDDIASKAQKKQIKKQSSE